MGLCEPCNCYGNADICDAGMEHACATLATSFMIIWDVPETGDCIGCREGSEGRSCERCSAGFDGDPTRGIPCAETTGGGGGGGSNCDCNSDGSLDLGNNLDV